MFDRLAMKADARKQLQGNKTVPAIITIIVIIIFTITTGFSSSSNNYEKRNFFPGLMAGIIQAIVIFAYTYYFILFKISSIEDKPGLNSFFDGFNYWFKALCAHLWRALWIVLWLLCFVIPGLIKMIAYSQMFYILAENSDISVRKALRMSIYMTQGHKSELFMMYLSFSGWFILSCLTAGILFVWTLPYMQLTAVNAYYYLKSQAIVSGILTENDFSNSDN